MILIMRVIKDGGKFNLQLVSKEILVAEKLVGLIKCW